MCLVDTLWSIHFRRKLNRKPPESPLALAAMLRHSLPPNHRIGPSETVTGCCEKILRDPCHHSESDKVGDQLLSLVDHISGKMSRIYSTPVCNIFDMPALARIGHGMRQFSRSAGDQSTDQLVTIRQVAQPGLTQRGSPALQKILPPATSPKCGAIFDSFF